MTDARGDPVAASSAIVAGVRIVFGQEFRIELHRENGSKITADMKAWVCTQTSAAGAERAVPREGSD